MKTLYIGGQSHKKNSGTNWKLYFYLILFGAFIFTTLKLTGSMIAEKLINRNGVKATGYSFSVRDVDFSLSKRELNLKDVKVFNSKTSTEILETPELIVHLDPLSIFQDKKLSITADKLDVILSEDLSSEVEKAKEHYFNVVEGTFGKLTIIEKKANQSRTVIELNEASVKVKESDFSLTSKIAEGGNLNLTGKRGANWTMKGSFKNVPSDIFNKIAGDKLPFAFTETKLNADIVAETENGMINGEISPEITKLNLIDEKPGIPTQTIKRVLNDELTFTLPFTLKNEISLEYNDTFRKLKSYRKSGPAAVPEARVSQAPAPKNKKAFSFWPF